MSVQRFPSARTGMATAVLAGVLVATTGGSFALHRMVTADQDAAVDDGAVLVRPGADTETSAAVAAAAASTGSPLQGTTAVVDSIGESAYSWADIRTARVEAAPDGTITASIEIAQWTDPASDDWRFGETGPTWPIDIDGDDVVDHRVRIGVTDGALRGTVAGSDGSSRCLGEVSADAASATYSVAFRAACIGNPEHFRFRGEFAYEDVTFDVRDGDVAPDAGWSAAVMNPAFVHIVVPLSPARLYESRNGPDDNTIDGKQLGGGPTKAGTIASIGVTGRGGVPDNASAVFLNVVAVGPTKPGYLTVFPCGTKPPLAANVNYNGNDIAANAVLAKIGTNGNVCIYTHATTDLVIDVNGYVPTTGSPDPLLPARLYESRNGPDDNTIDGKQLGGGPTKAGTIASIGVTGRGGVPDNASAVFLNVVAVGPTKPGYLTVFPCGTKPPLAANVNYNGNDIAANAVLAKIGTNGNVCIYTHATTDLVIDVNGYVPTTGSPDPLLPARLYESRNGPDDNTIDGKQLGGGPTKAGTIASIGVTGRGGVPDNASAVFLNVVAVGPTKPGYLTVFPCGTKPPLAANVNYNGNDIAANAVLAKIGTNGNVCIYTHATTDLVIDVNGYVPT